MPSFTKLPSRGVSGGGGRLDPPPPPPSFFLGGEDFIKREKRCTHVREYVAF